MVDKAKCEASIEEIDAEVTIMGMLKHEHILRLYESFESPKQLYLVMELATGGEVLGRGSHSAVTLRMLSYYVPMCTYYVPYVHASCACILCALVEPCIVCGTGL